MLANLSEIRARTSNTTMRIRQGMRASCHVTGGGNWLYESLRDSFIRQPTDATILHTLKPSSCFRSSEVVHNLLSTTSDRPCPSNRQIRDNILNLRGHRKQCEHTTHGRKEKPFDWDDGHSSHKWEVWFDREAMYNL